MGRVNFDIISTWRPTYSKPMSIPVYLDFLRSKQQLKIVTIPGKALHVEPMKSDRLWEAIERRTSALRQAAPTTEAMHSYDKRFT